jgi:hypothetical protein
MRSRSVHFASLAIALALSAACSKQGGPQRAEDVRETPEEIQPQRLV